MKKVFVSSTIYDLIDARAEVERYLREMHLIPVMSDNATSEFHPLPDRNSIETCLVNLAQCDAVIVILSQRYGPSLEQAGYDDLSATHLEYNEARKLGKPIHMYVRDRLEGDYGIFKKNKGKSVELPWVKDAHHKLFDLMEEHSKLKNGRPGSNWYDTFHDSIDLKALIKRDFRLIASRDELEALVVDDRVPIIDTQVEAEIQQTGQSPKVILRTTFRNVGTVPAYRFSWNMEGAERMETPVPVLAPHQETRQTVVLYGYGVEEQERPLMMTYHMAQGHRICDEYLIGVRLLPGAVIAYGAKHLSKTYHVASDEVLPFVVAEPE